MAGGKLLACLAAFLATFETSFAFLVPPDSGIRLSGVLSTRMAATSNEEDGKKNEGMAGSFFNPIPEASSPNPDEGDPSMEDEFDKSFAEIMKQRRSKPLASEPSTLGGVPTSEVTGRGFGKPGPKIIKTTNMSENPKKSFIGIGKPLNDINNPEYDDQGYTLYANEETGEKKRVFEALVDYPCDFTMKIVGANEGTFVSEIVQVVADSCEVGAEDIPFSERRNGKWTSVTVQAPVKSAEMLYMLYENIDRDPRVKFKF